MPAATAAPALGELVALLVGLAAGAAVAWLVARVRAARLEERLRAAEAELARTESLRRERGELELEATRLRAAREADAERLAWIATAQEQLRATFQNLAGQALQESSRAFLERSGEQLDNLLHRLKGEWAGQRSEIQGLVQPVEKQLDQLGRQVQEIEKDRRGAYDGLRNEIQLLRDAHLQLSSTTIGLKEALKSPTVRGRWGEVQLRRVVELAGLVEHVDFAEQPTVGGTRPDLVVHLPNDAVLPVDAKAPMQAFLEAVEAPDDAARKERLDAHGRALRQRVAELAQRRYWEQFEHAPDFVVMFLPNDAALGGAFERDPGFLDYALGQRVLPATPVTLLALLKAVAYGWQQQRLADNARRIAELGRKLHSRLQTFLGHFSGIGKGLESAIDAYNRAVGSFESRLLPAARRFEELGAAAEELPETAQVERGVRQTGPAEADDEPLPGPPS